MTTVTWYGHAVFAISHENTVLLVDPFLTGNPMAAVAADDLNPTAILVTHGHSDHLGDAFQISQRTDAPIVAAYELGLYLEAKGARVIPGNIGGTVAAGSATVKFVSAVHSSTVDDNGAFVAASVPSGFVVRLGGRTIYVAGDTALFQDMELIGEEGLDVAILPIGGQYTMDVADAVKAVVKLRPKIVIPGHYNTFPTIAADPIAFAEAVAAATRVTTVVLEPGQSTEI
ncbi:MAG TPA: metal-dependent hydrolase [Pseudonocardiaceae bacterium]|nr:metal-dependent hydrolase [Pseudonocardiaceae bacterium]